MSWRSIIAALGTAADLVRSAKHLRDTVAHVAETRNPSPAAPPPAEPGLASAQVAELQARTERLEASEAKQAELIAKMANQDQALWNQVQRLAQRLDKVFWMALIALVLSSALIVLELIRLFF